MAARRTLTGEDLTLAYDDLEVSRGLSVAIPPGRVTSVYRRVNPASVLVAE